MDTKEIIQQNINERLVTPPTQIEGGTMQDIIGSVSYELANIIDTRIDVILDNAFVTTADTEHLEIKGGELGIKRKTATKAAVFAKITGASPNFAISSNVIAKTEDGILFQVSEDGMTDSNGSVEIKMIALEEGETGNIQEGALSEFYEDYEGLYGAEITNLEMGFGGYDAEEIEDYRERILEYMRENAANSNIAQYTQWAKSVEGVKNVLVEDSTTAGAGHVNVYISSSNNVVTEELLQNVKERIEKEQIINAVVEIFPLQNFEVNINADLRLKEGYNLQNIKEEFTGLLRSYLNKKIEVVSYLYISNLFFETKGVEDVSGYLLNGFEESLNLGRYEIPVVGEITLGVIE